MKYMLNLTFYFMIENAILYMVIGIMVLQNEI